MQPFLQLRPIKPQKEPSRAGCWGCMIALGLLFWFAAGAILYWLFA
jgi:hypothetical protein